MKRRQFLKLSVLSSGALFIGIHVPQSLAEESDESTSGTMDLYPYIHINPDNSLHVHSYKQEMGQGVLNALAMIICEELDADWSTVSVFHQNFSRQIENMHEEFGRLNSGGSTSIPSEWPILRKAGASIKQVLLIAAAKRFGCDIADCICRNSAVHQKSTNKSLLFAQLIGDAANVTLPAHVIDNMPYKSRINYSLVGKSTPTNNVNQIVRGELVYGIDMEVDNMLYASILRPPTLGASVDVFDASQAMKIEGVIDVYALDTEIKSGLFDTGILGGIVVVGTSTWACLRAIKRLSVSWKQGYAEDASSSKLAETLRTLHNKNDHIRVRSLNYEPNHIASSQNTIHAAYHSPLLPHALMEPLNAVVDYKQGAIEVWAGTQSPQHTATNLAAHFGVAKEQIKIHVLHMGGGFGRRYYADFIIEAATISEKIGMPIKLQWTREDEIHYDRFHPMRSDEMHAQLDENGNIEQYSCSAVSTQQWGGGEITFPYDHKALSIESHFHRPHFVQTGPWRAVVAHLDVFSRECFIDELAEKCDVNPLDYRFQLLQGLTKNQYKGDRAERMKNVMFLQRMFIRVLQEIKVFSNWQNNPKDQGMGIALSAFHDKSFCAQVAVVKKDNDQIVVTDVYTVADCGLVINPNSVKAQIEGSIAWGLTPVLHGGVTFEQGKCQQSNFHNLSLLSMQQMPNIHTKLVDVEMREPCGVGEIAVPTVAPAVLNAVFSLTGKRYRDLTALAGERDRVQVTG
ncbi:molybdopterin cofactor-binding domain-containing protein [Thalassotalea euphylliae]|uniref:xanthine dehydrogenase family protein molybdopterin-binding subunit n=1 Tax=Thalassotalea euphylliae TaxID=1655234 RepID=UPI00363A3517